VTERSAQGLFYLRRWPLVSGRWRLPRSSCIGRNDGRPNRLQKNWFLLPQGLKPSFILGALIAALEALRHPKSEFFCSLLKADDKEEFMEVGEVEVVHLELKYCERCGGLWMRESGSGDVYCPPCAAQMSEFPPSRGRRAKPRLPVKQKCEIQSDCGDWTLVCSEGGTA